MDKITDSGVSPVLGTFLLLALSVVMIALVMISVNGIMGAYTPVYDRSVGFTIVVDATDSTALITPVSGTDLPFLMSYRVYTTNGQWDSPSPGGITVTDFNSTVHFVNIVGNFTDQVTALVFSGKVTIEGGQVVIEPVGGGYYVAGSDGYNTTQEFADSFNEWYNTYYNTGLHPGDDEYYVVKVHTNRKDFTFSNEYPIIVGDQPIEFSTYNIGNLNNGNIKIFIEDGGNFVRAPGYYDALLQIGNASDHSDTLVTIEKKGGDPLTFDGNFIGGVTSPLIIISSKATLVVQGEATLVVKNNLNVNGDGLGGGIYSEHTGKDGGKLDVKGVLMVTSNSAKYGGGIYMVDGKDISGENKIVYSNNTALLNPATNNIFKG
ncbi:MAG: hypothetical protein VB007_01950 [Methanocorpusculum sp.]|uniref:hypothetical protein n=1 Tax=Methanocorpusculum sp. TaxID=2058474 RepID=UPI002B1F1D81|nr:hypothetical protein [Methanocorpusculum sp.]MEA5085972.1 hypothetical protein [Methanocorpusculum sp.]